MSTRPSTQRSAARRALEIIKEKIRKNELPPDDDEDEEDDSGEESSSSEDTASSSSDSDAEAHIKNARGA